MAITFVNNALGATNSTTSFSITLPTTQANDIIILEYVHRGTGDATLGGTYNGGTLTEKHDRQFATSTFSGKTVWSRATGDHNGQTITGSGLTNSCAAIVTIYRGCVTSGDPLADATIVGEENASGNETQAEITTTTNGAWVVLVVANSPDFDVSSQTCTSPGTLTERAERLSTGGTDSSISHASAEKATAGATGAFTWSQTDSPSGSWAYALKPDTTKRAQISWAEFEVPNAPRRAQISWAEFEIPTAPRRAQISFAEFEIPTAPRRAQVSWGELEVPDPPSTERRAQISWAEMEVPIAPRRALISWAEMELPNAPRRAQISWAEFQIPSVGEVDSSYLGGIHLRRYRRYHHGG